MSASTTVIPWPEPEPAGGDVAPELRDPSVDPTDDPHLVRCALLAGYRGQAERVTANAVRRARVRPGQPVLAAVAAHCAGLVSGDIAQLLLAATMLDADRQPLAHAAALDDAGRALAAHDRPRAAAMLEAALRTYERVGATHDAARVRAGLRELGVHRRRHVRPGTGLGWQSLTPTELDVVNVICSGATNREAAEQLYLSPHTVSTHLRHAYAKLGISSRVELTRMAMSCI